MLLATLWDAIPHSGRRGLPGLPNKRGKDLTPGEQNSDRARLLRSIRAGLRWHSQRDLEHVRDYALFLLDREGNVQSWNNGAKAIKQYEANEIVGQRESGLHTRTLSEFSILMNERRRSKHFGGL